MKWFMTISSDSPIVSASPDRSASKSVLATIESVRCIRSSCRSRTCAVAPGREHPLGVLDHHRGVSLDLLALKCRLGQPALPPPEVALAGQEALADQRESATVSACPS